MSFDTLEYLLGPWRVERNIVDHRLGKTGVFVGAAKYELETSLTKKPFLTTVMYNEFGDIQFGEFVGSAQRELSYRRDIDSVLVSYFSDGERFTDLDLHNGEWRSWHSCGPDEYNIHTILRSDNRFEEKWRVKGAQKNYEATTTYERQFDNYRVG